MAAKPSNPSVEAMRGWLATLEQGLARNDRSVIYGVLRDAVPDFRRRGGLNHRGRDRADLAVSVTGRQPAASSFFGSATERAGESLPSPACRSG